MVNTFYNGLRIISSEPGAIRQEKNVACPHAHTALREGMADLKCDTLRLLRERPRYVTYIAIAEQCEVSVRWLENLVAGKIDNPAIKRLQAVNAMLTKRDY